MYKRPNNPFKKVLITILIIFVGLIIYILKPNIDMFKKDEALKLSSEKPWIENFNEFEENNQIDDIKISVTYNNPFKQKEEQEKLLQNQDLRTQKTKSKIMNLN